MPLSRALFIVLALVLVPSCAGQAGEAPPQLQPEPAAQRKSLFDPDLHLRTAEVREGMKGYGLSVFKGTAIERFEVEVIAVLRRSEQIAWYTATRMRRRSASSIRSPIALRYVFRKRSLSCSSSALAAA